MCLRVSGSFKIVGAFLISFSAFASNVAETGFTPAQRNLWSLQKVVRPQVPVVKTKSWVKNPVDAFILSKMEAKGVKPSTGSGPGHLAATRKLGSDRIASDSGGSAGVRERPVSQCLGKSG